MRLPFSRRSGASSEQAVEYAQKLIEERLAAELAEPLLLDGLPQRSPEDLTALARDQGVKPVERFEDLLGDFWPEDEDVDDFIAARRQWQWEGQTGPPKDRDA
jgi:hypothetical protein